MPDPRTLGMFLALLPQGHAWTRNPSSDQVALARACATEIDRIDDYLSTMIRNLNPSQADELLAEWEAFVGLPDTIDPYPSSTADRQKCVLAKLALIGGDEGAANRLDADLYGPDRPMWRRIAAILGHAPIVVWDYTTSRAGSFQAGAPIDRPLGPGSIDTEALVEANAVSAAMDAVFEYLLRKPTPTHRNLTVEFS